MPAPIPFASALLASLQFCAVLFTFLAQVHQLAVHLAGPMSLSSLESFIGSAESKCIACQPRPVTAAFAKLHAAAWSELLDVGNELERVRPVMARSFGCLPPLSIEVLTSWFAFLRDRMVTSKESFRMVWEQPAERCCSKVIRFASANPGHAGCTDFGGRYMSVNKFVRDEEGICFLFDKLELDVLGLPGARLPAGTIVPGRPDLKMWCRRGDASFVSCAVIWKTNSPYVFSCMEGLGSDRRLWLKVSGPMSTLVFLGVIYMPVIACVRAWLAELEGISRDIEMIKQVWDCPFVLLGDFNLQPVQVGGERKGCSKLQSAWKYFVESTAAVVLNASTTGLEHQAMYSAARCKNVVLRAHDTHFDTHGSKVLDLGLASRGVQCEFFVHNGISCRLGGRCAVETCYEFCRSDHFPVQACISTVPVPSNLHAKAPREWHDKDRWTAAVENADGVLLGPQSVFLSRLGLGWGGCGWLYLYSRFLVFRFPFSCVFRVYVFVLRGDDYGSTVFCSGLSASIATHADTPFTRCTCSCACS